MTLRTMLRRGGVLRPAFALILFSAQTALSSPYGSRTRPFLQARLRGGSTTPPSEATISASSDVDATRFAAKTAKNVEAINRGLESISLHNPSSPGRTSSPALVLSPPGAAAAGTSRVAPRQRANESYSTASPKSPAKTESVFQRLYQSSQQREQNLERLRQQQEAREAKKNSPRTKHAGGGDVFKRLSTTGTCARPIHAPPTNRSRSGSRPKPIDWRKVGTPASRGESSPPKARPPKSEVEATLSGMDHRELVEKCKILHARVKELEAAEGVSRSEAERAREDLQVMQGRYEQLNTLLDEMSTALEDALDRMRDLQERFPWIAYVGGRTSSTSPPPPQQAGEWQ